MRKEVLPTTKILIVSALFLDGLFPSHAGASQWHGSVSLTALPINVPGALLGGRLELSPPGTPIALIAENAWPMDGFQKVAGEWITLLGEYSFSLNAFMTIGLQAGALQEQMLNSMGSLENRYSVMIGVPIQVKNKQARIRVTPNIRLPITRFSNARMEYEYMGGDLMRPVGPALIEVGYMFNPGWEVGFRTTASPLFVSWHF